MGLDPKERISICNFISEIVQNKIVIFATHVMSDIEFIAKEIILLKSGKFVDCNITPNLLSRIEYKVFEVEIIFSELEQIQSAYRISNLYHNESRITARIVTDTPSSKLKLTPVSLTLEDLYLYIFE